MHLGVDLDARHVAALTVGLEGCRHVGDGDDLGADGPEALDDLAVDSSVGRCLRRRRSGIPERHQDLARLLPNAGVAGHHRCRERRRKRSRSGNRQYEDGRKDDERAEAHDTRGYDRQEVRSPRRGHLLVTEGPAARRRDG